MLEVEACLTLSLAVSVRTHHEFFMTFIWRRKHPNLAGQSYVWDVSSLDSHLTYSLPPHPPPPHLPEPPPSTSTHLFAKALFQAGNFDD